MKGVWVLYKEYLVERKPPRCLYRKSLKENKNNLEGRVGSVSIAIGYGSPRSGVQADILFITGVYFRVVDPDPAGSEIICMFGSGSVI